MHTDTDQLTPNVYLAIFWRPLLAVSDIPVDIYIMYHNWLYCIGILVQCGCNIVSQNIPTAVNIRAYEGSLWIIISVEQWLICGICCRVGVFTLHFGQLKSWIWTLKPGFQYPSWRPESTRLVFWKRAPVNTARVDGGMETGHPSTRAVNSGRQLG